MDGFIDVDDERKALTNPARLHERRVFPCDVARPILSAALAHPTLSKTRMLHRSPVAILLNFVFFIRGVAGAALCTANISAYRDRIDLAIALRKKHTRMPHALTYRHTPAPN